MCADSFVTRAATGVLPRVLTGVGFVGVAVTAAIAIAAFYVVTGADQTARTPRQVPSQA